MHDLLDFQPLFEFEAREKYFFNLPQILLAYAFYLAKIGREAEGRRYMSEWLQRSDHREETQKTLVQLFEDAAASPLRVQ